MTTLTQTYRRLAHDTEHCACHRCERINRSEFLRVVDALKWWGPFTVSAGIIAYYIVKWAVAYFPGFTRIN